MGTAESSPDRGASHRLQQSQPDRLSETGERVFESLSLGLIVFDPHLAIVHHNPAARFLVDGRATVAEALAAGSVESAYQDWAQLLRDVLHHGRARRFDQVLYRDSRQGERLLNIECIPLTDPETGKVTGGTLVLEDVTATVSMEKRLAVSERMAAVGNLAARVAHELNNPLDGILRYLNLALRAVETDATDKIPDYLIHARGGLLRMADILRELVDFSRSAATSFDDASINAVVEEAIKVMSEQAVDNKVSVICTLQDGMPAIQGTSLFQLCCNMIKNAIDAMPDGGTLTVTTRILDRHAIIRFEDTGVGLPEEMDRIFEPFYTTKGPGKGTGLGLAICKDIIEKLSGRIVPARRASGGTTFAIEIPLEHCVPLRPAGSPTGTTPLGATGPRRRSRYSSSPDSSSSEQDNA